MKENKVELTVAKTILAHLGGQKFITMVGAKNFAGTKNALSFQIGQNSKKITHVKIVLNSADLYDVTFYRILGVEIKTEMTFANMYCGDLKDVFERETGMYTRLI